MIKISTIFWTVLVILAGSALFTISYTVKAKQEHLALVQRDIVKIRDEARVLNAEWSYLNQPERLEGLMKKYSTLQPMKHQQLASYDAVPVAKTVAPVVLASAPKAPPQTFAATPTLTAIKASAAVVVSSR